jgi:hypothetical protein
MKDFKFLKTQDEKVPNLNGRTYPRYLISDNNYTLNDMNHIRNYILHLYFFGTVITLLVKYLVNAGF